MLAARMRLRRPSAALAVALLLLASVPALAATRMGTSKSDLLRGTPRADRMSGLKGNDRVLGLGGPDRIYGNTGRDRVDGGAGNDRISVRDGRRDRVSCGAGRDTVTADRRDVLLRCERRRFR